MLFTAKTLSTLEYDKIIKMLISCAATDGAKARAASLSPTDDFELVSARQKKTDDAKRLINTKGYPSFSANERVVSAAERAYKGGFLITVARTGPLRPRLTSCSHVLCLTATLKTGSQDLFSPRI